MTIRGLTPPLPCAWVLVALLWTLVPACLAQPTPPPPPEHPGKVLEIWVDRRSGVTSAWLSNGVLLHYKQLAPDPAPAEPDERRRPSQVAVSFTIAGAELLETAENRGVSDGAVAAAWAAKSVRSMKPGELDAFLDAAGGEGNGATLRSFAGGDAFIITLTCSADALEPALRGVRLLLTEPAVDPDALTRWKDRTIQQVEARQQAGNDAVNSLIAALFGPQEARARRPGVEHIRAITVERTQAWLDAALGTAPIAREPAMPMEVAIVGDLPIDRALRLAELYVASLPTRERITEATLAERRVAQRPKQPPEVLPVANWKGAPLVIVGFFGADIRDIADYRALALAARILNARLGRLPPEQNDAGQGNAWAVPASVYPGFGLFLAAVPARAGSEAAARDNISNLLTDLITAGPTPEELSTATADLASSAAKLLSDPVYWARTLSRSTYHGVRIPDIGIAPSVYRDMPATAIQATLRKYATPDRAFRLVVKPGEDAAPDRTVER